MTFNDKGAFSWCAPDGIGRRDVGADHNVRIACEADVVYTCTALRQRTLPALTLANICRFPPPKELLQNTLGPLVDVIGAA